MSFEKPSGHKEFILVIHSIGTGSNMTVARMVISYIRWLAIVAETNVEHSELFAQMIHFQFANTDSTSLDTAKWMIRREQTNNPNIIISMDWDVMYERELEGDGAGNQEEGEAAIKDYMPRAKEIMPKGYFYIPIATVGTGQTGTNAILPIVEEAVTIEGLNVFPFIILSAETEMAEDGERLVLQKEIRHRLSQMNIRMMVADNGYLNTIQNDWNLRLATQSSFSRIDFVAIHSLRVLLMMFIHTIQIDRRKLKKVVFAGPGSLICVGGADFDVNRSEDEEIERIVHLLVETPMALEIIEDESRARTSNKFDVMVLGTMGSVSGPVEEKIRKAIKEYRYVKENIGAAEFLPQRFASYLPEKAASIFLMMAKHRKGEDVPVILPPHDHYLIQRLNELEMELLSDIAPETLGRSSEISGSNPPKEGLIKKPVIPIDYSRSAQAKAKVSKEIIDRGNKDHAKTVSSHSAPHSNELASYAELIKTRGTVDKVVDALNSDIVKIKPSNLMAEYVALFELLSTDETGLTVAKINDAVMERLIDEMHRTTDYEQPKHHNIQGRMFAWNQDIETLEALYKEASIQVTNPEERDALENLRRMILFKRVIGSRVGKGSSMIFYLFDAVAKGGSTQAASR